MSNIENVAMLYLLNQDLQGKSLDEIYTLYLETLDKAKKCPENYRKLHDLKTFEDY